MMTPYGNLSGNAGVKAYEIHDTYIDIMYHGSNYVYRYTYEVTGVAYVEKLKTLALKGEGLSSYISRNSDVKKNYAMKFVAGKTLR